MSSLDLWQIVTATPFEHSTVLAMRMWQAKGKGADAAHSGRRNPEPVATALVLSLVVAGVHAVTRSPGILTLHRLAVWIHTRGFTAVASSTSRAVSLGAALYIGQSML